MTDPGRILSYAEARAAARRDAATIEAARRRVVATDPDSIPWPVDLPTDEPCPACGEPDCVELRHR